MRKYIGCVTLAICLILNCFSPFIAKAEMDEELDLANRRGFVPDELWQNLSDVAAMKDFSLMLYNIIAETDIKAAEQFKDDSGDAMTVDSLLDRSFASISLYYACADTDLPETLWYVLENENNDAGWSSYGAELNDVIGDCWDELQHLIYLPENSGTFPRRDEGGEAWENHWDDLEVAAYFSLLNRSTFEGKFFFDYDSLNNDMHMDYPVTNEEAIRAANRFYEMYHGGEAMADVMQNKNATSIHKKTIIDTEIKDNIAIGTHLNLAGTDWTKDYTEGIGYLGGYDNLYDHILGERVTRTSFETIKKSIKAYGDAGIDIIRLPITWLHFVDNRTYEIDPFFMDYVEYLVNLILDEGMYCIITSMRDYAGNSDMAWVNDAYTDEWMEAAYNKPVNERFSAIWKQIAERFRDYDEHLIFEAMNEPQEAQFPTAGTVRDFQAARIQELDELFVNLVRSSGGNNENRTLIIECLWGQFFLESLIPPEDDHLMASYHCYFLEEGGLSIYGLDNDVPTNEEGFFTEWSRKNNTLRTWVEMEMKQIHDFIERTGVPVIVGETGTSSVLSPEDNKDMLSFVIEEARKLNIPVITWDNIGFNYSSQEFSRPDLLEVIMEYAR